MKVIFSKVSNLNIHLSFRQTTLCHPSPVGHWNRIEQSNDYTVPRIFMSIHTIKEQEQKTKIPNLIFS